MKKILVFAYGNPGRSDDGLGYRCVTEIEKWISENKYSNITTDCNYQLNIENAEQISRFDIVVFIDASKAEIENFLFSKLEPNYTETFSTHSVTPHSLAALCVELYEKKPETFLLQIKGYTWELGEELSNKATENLNTAVHFLQNKLLTFN